MLEIWKINITTNASMEIEMLDIKILLSSFAATSETTATWVIYVEQH